MTIITESYKTHQTGVEYVSWQSSVTLEKLLRFPDFAIARRTFSEGTENRAAI